MVQCVQMVNIIETEKERKISGTNYFVDFMFMLIEYFNRDTLIFCKFGYLSFFYD